MQELVAGAFGDGSGVGVEDAEGADELAFGAVQGDAGVEADVRVGGDHRESGEAIVGEGVFDDEEFTAFDHGGAEGFRPWDVLPEATDAGLEPDAVFGNHGELCHGDADELGGDEDDVVEGGFAGRVEHAAGGDGGKAALFGLRLIWPVGRPLVRLWMICGREFHSGDHVPYSTASRTIARRHGTVVGEAGRGCNMMQVEIIWFRILAFRVLRVAPTTADCWVQVVGQV